MSGLGELLTVEGRLENRRNKLDFDEKSLFETTLLKTKIKLNVEGRRGSSEVNCRGWGMVKNFRPTLPPGYF